MAKSRDREARRQYVKNNADQFALYTARYRDKIKLEMIAAYGGKCKNCGEDDPIVLTIDHIHNDAYVDRPRKDSRCGHATYVRLKRDGWPKDRYQLLCHNCNVRKEYQRRREEMIARRGDPADLDPAPKNQFVPFNPEEIGL